MAYLELSNPKTRSCNFKVKLSNPFNTDYYRKLRITGTDYGSETSSVNSYVETITAADSSSEYVEGVVNAGLYPGRTVKLYAYAQAANGRWYLAGSDTITMKNEEANLKIVSITELTDVDDFKVGKEVSIWVEVENIGNARSSDYTIKVYDEDGNKLTSDPEGQLGAGNNNVAYLDITVNKPGRQTLEFYISGGESEDRTEYRTYIWKMDEMLYESENGNYSIGRYNDSDGDRVKFKLNTTEGTVTTSYMSVDKYLKPGTTEYEIKKKTDSFLEHLKLADAQIERGQGLLAPDHISGGSVGTLISNIVDATVAFEESDIVDLFTSLFEIVPPIAASEGIGCLAFASLNYKYCRDRAKEISDLDDKL